MTKLRTRLRSLAVVGAVAVGTMALTACPERKGPAEQAGEKMDKAVDDLEDAINPKGPAEKAGEKIDKALGND